MSRHQYLSAETVAMLLELRQAKSTEQRAALVEAALKRPITLQALWEYRPHIRALTDAQIASSPSLIIACAIIAILEGHPQNAQAILAALPADSPYAPYAKLIQPGVNWQVFIEQANMLAERFEGPVPDLSITAGRPFVFNGFQDFSPHWEQMKENEEQTRSVLRALYGDDSSHIFVLFQVESLYQRNQCFDALVQIVGLLPSLTSSQNLRLLFVALTLQTYIMVMNGQTRSTVPMMDALRRQMLATGMDEWLPNLDALDAFAAMYDGDYARISRWMNDDAPDEYADFCMLDLFRYMIKLRVYLIQRKHLAFFSLASKLAPLLEFGNRMMDSCELHTLWALSDHARGDKQSAFIHLRKALELAERYRYDRLIADEGEHILRLLISYQKEHKKTDYLAKVISLAQKVAALYPHYLKEQLPEQPALTESELAVLRLIADGRSNQEIAELMQLSVNTIKAHCKHIAVKLQTSNRRQAVFRAIELGIIPPLTEPLSDNA